MEVIDPYYGALIKATQNGELIDFGELIAFLREDEPGWTQERLAQSIGMPLQTLKRIESNVCALSVDHLNAILMVFGLQVGVSFYRTNDYSIPDQVKANREKVFTMEEIPR